MVTALGRLTLSEYLNYENGTDTLYELVNGELIPMSLGSGLHSDLAEFLHDEFTVEIKRVGLPWTAKQMTVGIQSPQRGRWDTCRIPDVTVLPIEQWQQLRSKQEAIITLNEPPPLLVVEVVSKSTKIVDYRAKRSEYTVLGIPEYWIVDPLAGKITICELIKGFYDTTEFSALDEIRSPTFKELRLTVAEEGRRQEAPTHP
ncbi:MAG: Uma2 family endonuclease [Symploca sp. SIO2C1]|nr:Uma2 family endonuclease [Symploca sp. SIO2C1]